MRQTGLKGKGLQYSSARYIVNNCIVLGQFAEKVMILGQFSFQGVILRLSKE